MLIIQYFKGISHFVLYYLDANTTMEQQVNLLFNDFVKYALPFFDKYDSLEKIEKYFDDK